MIVWTVANQKGGVGKTTTVITLAGILARRGKKVLVLDTDPHSSLTSCFGYDSDDLEHTLFDLFLSDSITKDLVKSIIIDTSVSNIKLMAGSLALATLDQTLGQRQSQAGLILKKSLQAINDEFDCAIVDCPPVLGVMMVNALAASSSIIVPTQTEFLALKGLERMMKTFEILRGTKAKPLRYLIVPTMFDRRTRASNQTLESIKEAYGDVVWRDVIPIDTRFRDCSELHVPAPIKFPYSKGCLAYEKLLNDLLKVEGQTK